MEGRWVARAGSGGEEDFGCYWGRRYGGMAEVGFGTEAMATAATATRSPIAVTA